MGKPKPVPQSVICSECGLPWVDHTRGRKETEPPTTDVCVHLLKAALAVRPAFSYITGSTGITPTWRMTGGGNVQQ